MSANNTAMSAVLLLSPRNAAKALSVSERTLWNQTVPRGPIPSIRIGKRGVRYSLAALHAWIEQQPPAAV